MGGFRPIQLLAQAQTAAAKGKGGAAAIDLELIQAVFEPKKEAFEALAEKAKSRGVNEEIAKLFAGMVATWPIREILENSDKAAESAGRDRAKHEEIANTRRESLFALFKGGQSVDDKSSDLYIPFWVSVAEESAKRKDVAAGERSIGLLEAFFSDNERALAYFKSLRAQLTGADSDDEEDAKDNDG